MSHAHIYRDIYLLPVCVFASSPSSRKPTRRRCRSRIKRIVIVVIVVIVVVIVIIGNLIRALFLKEEKIAKPS